MFGSPSPSDDPSPSSSAPPLTSPCSENPNNTKRKRRPAGTPDPDAEVVSLSPRTLLESDRYVCDICNQGFQREQNLQMHRRRHKVPWKLVKREGPPAGEARKRVFVCPEPSCLHHDPAHALGDLVGIKKHFRRKHSESRQWECARCSKAYAVQSDYKAHLKTCGTRGHFCDCGRVFSRVESFIEHQDTCSANHARAATHTPPPGSGSRTTSSPNPSNDTNLTAPAAGTWPGVQMPKPTVVFLQPDPTSPTTNDPRPHNLELQLSIGSASSTTPKDDEMEQLRVAIGEKAMADEARRQAQMNVELAEQEFANAKRVRQQARAELDKACVLRDEVAKQINSVLVTITCHECQQERRVKAAGDGETKISDT